MSPRAAGDSDHYTWLLNGDPTLPMIELVSVTTILHRVFGAPQYVVDWAANNFKDAAAMREYRDVRSDEGTKAHAYVETCVGLQAKGEATPEPASGFDEAFVRFTKEHNPTWTLSENVIYSTRRGYAGTLDLGLLESGGRTRIIDVKTKKSTIYKAYDTELIQCRAYATAAYEMGLVSEPEAETGILILKPNGRYTYDDRSVPLSTWERTLDLYHEIQNMKGLKKS